MSEETKNNITNNVIAQQESAGIHPRRRNWLWRFLQLILNFLSIFWLRVRVQGREHIDPEQGGLLLLNHQSNLDPPLFGSVLDRPVSYWGRDTLFKNPITGWILRRVYVMPINRDSAGTASIRVAVKRLETGFLVGIFPEGTRTTDGGMQPFKPGFRSLLKRTKVPIYPVGIDGMFQALPRGAWFLRPTKVAFVIGAPLDPAELKPLLARDRSAELLTLMEQKVGECRREARRLTGRISIEERPPAANEAPAANKAIITESQSTPDSSI